MVFNFSAVMLKSRWSFDMVKRWWDLKHGNFCFMTNFTVQFILEAPTCMDIRLSQSLPFSPRRLEFHSISRWVFHDFPATNWILRWNQNNIRLLRAGKHVWVSVSSPTLHVWLSHSGLVKVFNGTDQQSAKDWPAVFTDIRIVNSFVPANQNPENSMPTLN